MLELGDLYLAPYVQISTTLIGKERRSGGNMFRHQMDTFAILLDYGYTDSVLLKASLIHDVVEDIPDFDIKRIIPIDDEASDVLDLVLQVTKKKGQSKEDFLRSIISGNSENAKILKTADRISNMISLGYVTDLDFINRYCNETEFFIFPIALDVNFDMYQELIKLVMSRRKFLEECGYLDRIAEKKNETDYPKAFTD
ncbi:MAG: hypothetical protein IIW10_07155 [Spirochaetaceae bacterium]|nr:hypothetical protein [Spirochaetaceae bacterium]